MGTRLLADCSPPCNNSSRKKGMYMAQPQIRRRTFMKNAGALAATMTLPLDRVFAKAAAELPKIPLPPTIAEMLKVPAEIRTWNEDEEPLKLVAGFLKERNAAAARIGFEETDRFWIMDRLKRQLPAAAIVSANPVVRAQRMIKTPAELA